MPYVNDIPSLQDFKNLIGHNYSKISAMMRRRSQRIIDIDPIFCFEKCGSISQSRA